MTTEIDGEKLSEEYISRETHKQREINSLREINPDIFLYIDDMKDHYQIIGSMMLNLYTEDEIFNFN